MIRRCREDDVELLVELRREALAAHPTAFSASPDGDVALDPEHLRAVLGRPGQATFGAFVPELVGMAGVYRARREKLAHKAEMAGMYVRPSYRRRGLGGALLTACIEEARSWSGPTHLHLAVDADAEAAIHLYRSSGFENWGSEPAGLVVDGRPVTLLHMVLRLEGRALPEER